MNKKILLVTVPLRIFTLLYQENIFSSELPFSSILILRIIYIIADILTSLRLHSYEYLLASILLPLNCDSLENLILSLVGSDYVSDDILYYLLCNFSIFYFPLSLQFLSDNLLTSLEGVTLSSASSSNQRGFFRRSLISILIEKFDCKFLEKIFTDKNLLVSEYYKSYGSSHLPCFNITWFFFLHIFEQYSHLFYHYFYIIAFYLIRSVKKKECFEIICLFRSSSFKNWLPIIHKDEHFHFYFILYILYLYVDYLLNVEGLANPNFLNWISFVFISFFLAKKFIMKISKKSFRLKN